MTGYRPGADLLATLSLRAVGRVAAVADRTSAADCTRMLYTAGSVAVGPRAERFGDPRWIAHVATSAASDAAGYFYHCHQGWHSWTAEPVVAAGPDLLRESLVHKVYVSPRPEVLALVLPLVVATATAGGAGSWKVGATADGIHRADKIVVYFDSAAGADRAAAVVADKLRGFPAQGVLFTGQVGASGMVSRGQDQRGTSWRMLVCTLLGQWLTSYARPGVCSTSVAGNALRRLDAYGVDTRSWFPTAVLDPAEVA